VRRAPWGWAGGGRWGAREGRRGGGGDPAGWRSRRGAPRAALTVDRYWDDWDELAWVRVLGRVAIVPADQGRSGLDALSAKYEPYREEAPPGPLLALQPERYLWWRAAEGT